jgi:serine/threonine protein kinase
MSTPVQTVEEFLAVTRRSGLVEESKLAAAIGPWVGHGGPPPEPMLQALIDADLLTRWQIDQLLKGRYKGFTLGKYRLLRLLGAGGMSSVYLAEHATLHSKAAVKVLPLKRVEQTSYLARFEQEARLAARLNHPNIVRTFDLDTAGSVHFIAMEYVEGIDLHAKVKREGPLPVREAADYIRQAAVGLQHAHEEGLVHRDIKPANLVLDTRGTIKVLDLGLALAVTAGDEDCSLTREHDEKVLGTADYLAPEQAADSHKAERRSDIYSLGCTLYYLLVGKAPFASGNAAARMQAHLNKPPPNLIEQRPDVPIAIAELYFRMMQKATDGRPQSAQEVADALAAWLASTDQGGGRRVEGPRRQLPRRAVAVSTEPAGTTVVRSGPGSGSSGIFPGLPTPGVGSSGNLPKPPAAVVAAPDGGEPPIIVVEQAKPKTPSPPAAAGDAAKQAARGRKRPAGFAGLPIGLWIVIAVGLILAGILAVAVFMKNSG